MRNPPPADGLVFQAEERSGPAGSRTRRRRRVACSSSRAHRTILLYRPELVDDCQWGRNNAPCHSDFRPL